MLLHSANVAVAFQIVSHDSSSRIDLLKAVLETGTVCSVEMLKDCRVFERENAGIRVKSFLLTLWGLTPVSWFAGTYLGWGIEKGC
jgi:hypothetical protein